MAYTNESKVEKYLGSDVDSSLSSEVTNWIAVVTAWINRYTGKTFETASADRYYDGHGGVRLLVDSFVGNPTIETLNSDGTTGKSLTEGQANDYLTYPLNETEKSEIVLVPNGVIATFPVGIRRVKITADWGATSSVPSDVEFVATRLVAGIIEKSLKGGKLASVTLGDYEADFQEIDEVADALGIYNILDTYRELEV